MTSTVKETAVELTTTSSAISVAKESVTATSNNTVPVAATPDSNYLVESVSLCPSKDVVIKIPIAPSYAHVSSELIVHYTIIKGQHGAIDTSVNAPKNFLPAATGLQVGNESTPITSQPEKLSSSQIDASLSNSFEKGEFQDRFHLLPLLCPEQSIFSWVVERTLVNKTVSIDFNESKSTCTPESQFGGGNNALYMPQAAARLTTLNGCNNGVPIGAPNHCCYPRPPITLQCPPDSALHHQGVQCCRNRLEVCLSEPSPYTLPTQQKMKPVNCRQVNGLQSFQDGQCFGDYQPALSFYSPAYYSIPQQRGQVVVLGPALPDQDRARRLELQEQAKHAGICPLCSVVFCCCCVDVSKDFVPPCEQLEQPD